MFRWIHNFFTNEKRYLDSIRQIKRKAPAYFRFCIALLGYLIDQGIIPTYVPGGGQKLGLLLVIVAFLVRAGEFNQSASRQIEEDKENADG